MENKKEIVDGIEKLLDMLPELNKEENEKVGEIKEMLNKIRKNVEKESGMER